MAKILVAFFNGIEDPENLNAKPIFYEAFINGLDKSGNEVAVFTHGMFGMDFGEIDENTKQLIVDFKPDICFVFNNSFFDISEVVSCPIVIYEVDSPRYFSNKENIRKNPERYLYFVAQEDSIQTLKEEYSVNESRIFYVPFFTEVYADDSIKQTTNISFIGSLFDVNSPRYVRNFMKQSPSQEEWAMMGNCLNHIRKNPLVTATELIYKYNITSEIVARSLNLPELLMMLSSEKRLKVLTSLTDLGLDLYGTKSWSSVYYWNIDLNMAYIDKRVYSIKHNQDIYNSSKIGINVSHYQATTGFPWRVMDIMASNACLVTDNHSSFNRLFRNVPIPVYESVGEVRDICKCLINDESRRREIVLQCQEVINNKYRFRHLLPKLEEYSGVKMHS